MSEPGETDIEALRIRARERIEQGRLPRGKAARTWGGLGTGLRCDLCDAPISGSEPEFELQLDLASTESLRLHRQCHTIWNEVREACQPDAWRPVSRELPPLNSVVEARVGLRDARAIILNVICLSAAPEAVWVNATTGGPLPEGWRPFEWRPLRDAQGASPKAVSSGAMPREAARSGAGAGRAGAGASHAAEPAASTVPKRA